MDVDGNFNSLRQRVGGGGRGDAPSPAQDSDKQVLARRRSSKIDQEQIRKYNNTKLSVISYQRIWWRHPFQRPFSLLYGFES